MKKTRKIIITTIAVAITILSYKNDNYKLAIAPLVGAALISGASALAGQGIQMGAAKLNNTKNFERTKQLMEKQDAMNRSMALFNQQQQLEFWKKTGPVGNMEQLKLAGLNPGLMYGMSGAGSGTTDAAQAAPISQGSYHGENPGAGAGAMGIALGQTAMQTQLLQAQKENIEADTANKLSENPNISKEGTKLDTEIESLTQGINNQKAIERLTDIESDIKEIDKQIKSATAEQAISMASQQNQIAEQQIRSMVRNNYIDQETAQTKIKQAGATLAKTWLENSLIKTNTSLAQADIDKINTEIKMMLSNNQINWRALETHQNEVAAKIKEINNNVQNNDTPASIRAIQDFGKALTGFGILIK